MKFFILRISVFLLLLLLLVEVVFRTVIPASDQPFYAQDSTYKIRMFDTTGVRYGYFTEGRLAEERFKWRVNNRGWNAGIDYVNADLRESKLIAITGDSYVEGFYVNWEDHFANRLKEKLVNTDVYSFGVSGMSFAQYILVNRYLRDQFSPDYIVVFLGSGRLRSSLAEISSSPYNLQFAKDDNGHWIEKPPMKVVFGYGKIMRMSAFVRYLIKNAGVTLGLGAVDNEPVGKKRDKVKEIYITDRQEILDVTRHIVKTMYKENPKSQFIFLIDGPRQELIDGVFNPPSVPDADILKEITNEIGGVVVDMRERFNSEHIKYGKSFSFPRNYHWNAYANDLVAQELAALFSQLPEPSKARTSH